jgi:hopene-associated glycosyltransferase HpnB
MTLVLLIALLSLAAWLYLLMAHGDFWCGRERDEADAPPPQAPAGGWPDVVAIVPARNEADVVAGSIGSLLRQDYEGSLRVILVDDQSSDGTAGVAQGAAAAAGCRDRLTVLAGRDLPAGWTGKLWAISQGVDHAESLGERPEFLLLSDADIGYAADSLSRQVALAESGGFVLVSRMAKLRCENLAERALIPAFIFFFQMLFPFAWVNRADRATAAAAGGCMLVRRRDLQSAGAIASIRDALIDDCALAARLKTQGPIRLELTERAVSLRPYPSLGEIRRMVARSAYAQLRYSPLLLLGTFAGMALIYVAPPALALFAVGGARLLGILAWLAMAFAFQPTLRLYRLSPLWGLALPAIAAVYLFFTLDSAYQHGRGRGGMWKGRAQAPGSGTA